MSRNRRVLAGLSAGLITVALPMLGIREADADYTPPEPREEPGAHSVVTFSDEHAQKREKLLHDCLIGEGVPHKIEVRDGRKRVRIADDDAAAREAFHRIDAQERRPSRPTNEQDRARMQRTVDYLVWCGVQARIDDRFGVLSLDVDWSDIHTQMALSDLEWEEGLLTPEDISRDNEKKEKEAAFLREQGVPFVVMTSRYGKKFVDADLENVDVAIAVQEHQWLEDPWAPEEITKHNAWLEELVTRLRREGIIVGIKTSRYGVKHLDIHQGDPRFRAAIARISKEEEPGRKLLFGPNR